MADVKLKNNYPELYRLLNVQKASIEAHSKIKEALVEAMKMWDDYEEFYNGVGDILGEMEDTIIKPTSLKEHHARIAKLRKLHKSKEGLF